VCQCVGVYMCAYARTIHLCVHPSAPSYKRSLTRSPPHPLPRPLLHTHKDAALQRITLVATHQECVSATLVVSHTIQSAGFARAHTHTHKYMYTPPPRVRFCHFNIRLHDSKRCFRAHTHMHAKTHTYTPLPGVRFWYFSGKSHINTNHHQEYVSATLVVNVCVHVQVG